MHRLYHPCPYHPCENAGVPRHSSIMRALAALLSALLLSPSAQAAAQSQSDATDPAAQARTMLGKAAELAQQSRHAAAAEAVQKAIALLTAQPALLDEAAGKLLSDAALQLAIERLVSGDEDGGEAALALLVRLDPDRQLSAADYPPAFLVELQGVRKRLLAAPRGSLRVLAPPGAGEARALVDGRAVPKATALVEDLIPGEHFVRLERAGVAWGQKVVVIAGVETPVAAPAPVVPALEPARRVALPGTRTDEPPSRALVIPRQPTTDESEPLQARPVREGKPAVTHLEALEPEAIKTARETPRKSSHATLWIVAGVLVAGALAAGGYFLYQSGQTPTTANVNATWSH